MNSCVIQIFGDNNFIKIGNQCHINQGNFWIEDCNGSITIGNKTTVHGETEFAVIEGQHIVIGKDCMFSSKTRVVTGDSHSLIDAYGNRINSSDSISFGNYVWCGANVICLKGVTIPDNRVIGTGSLVNKVFEILGTVIAGVPAKIVKKEIGWLRERI